MLALNQVPLLPKLVTKGAQYWDSWRSLVISQDHFHESVTIALVGKYLYQPDALVIIRAFSVQQQRLTLVF